MNEHSIREIARVAYEAHNEYAVTALGHPKKNWGELSDEENDKYIEMTRAHLENLTQFGNTHGNGPTEKVFVRVIIALANSERLL